MLSRDRGREECLLIVRGGCEGGRRRRYGFGRCCRVVGRRRSMLVGGDPSCFLLLVGVVAELFPGAFLCALERNVFAWRIVGELQEGG
jgi:hypothetical protein